MSTVSEVLARRGHTEEASTLAEASADFLLLHHLL